MAHKTFISYKYSEARTLRDKIITALGEDATYYQGETSASPNLTDYTTETIKQKLRDMMYNTSVTIVIISPHMCDSKWIDWEIEYSLKRISRRGRISQTNGVVAVIMKDAGGYGWFQTLNNEINCCKTYTFDSNKVHDIIHKNCFNQYPPVYACPKCRSINLLTGSYISYITEEDFLKKPESYINNAYKKSENNASGYTLTRNR